MGCAPYLSFELKMFKMSFREPFNYPYVTSRLPGWSPTPSVGDDVVSEYTIKPGEDPSKILNLYSVVKLQRGATYYWSNVDVNKTVTILGNGATIKCPAVSYCLRISSQHTKIFNCVFHGRNVSRTGTTLEDNGLFGLWLANGLSCIVSGCSFVNFSGAAFCVFDYGSVISGGHLIDNCYFEGCRAGMALVSGGSDLVDGSLVRGCRFVDCQYGLYSVSIPGWCIRDCFFSRTRSAVFHQKRSLMSYGDALSGREAVGGFAVVSGCVFRSSISANWDDTLGSEKLAAVYFDDEQSCPIRVSDCLFLDSDLAIGKFISNPKYSLDFVVGCSFWYLGSQDTSDFDVIRNMSGSSSNVDIYFSSCSGRVNCKVRGFKKPNVNEAGNFDDPEFVAFPEVASNVCKE